MVLQVIMVFGGDNQRELQIKDVDHFISDDKFTTFYGTEGEELAVIANDGILYFKRISLG